MIAGWNVRWMVAFWLALGSWLPALHARAQDQFVLLDQTYTATAANTMDSHYRVDPRAGTPSNWRAPIDYASGKVHARLDIIAKPSAKKTLYNICFEATPSYACMPYSPAYTATGVIDFEYPFSAFYQYDDVDWSKGTRDIALILKDENEAKPQGSPDFYPTTVHVTLTVIKPGATYVPPVDVMDAGMPADPTPTPDAGQSTAGSSPDAGTIKPSDAGQKPAAPAGGGHAGSGSAASGSAGAASAGSSAGSPASNGASAGTSAPPSTPAGATAGATAAGTTGAATNGSAAGPTAPQSTPPPEPNKTVSGCSLAHGRSHTARWEIALLLLAASRRRKRTHAFARQHR